MSNYIRVAEVYSGSETIRLIKTKGSVIVDEGDLILFHDGSYGEVITVAYMNPNDAEYRIIDHIKPIEDYKAIYRLRYDHSEEDNNEPS